MTKIMYVNSNSMQILSGVERMDEVLAKPVLKQPEKPKQARAFDVEFKNVSFSYDEDGETEALSDVSFAAKQGEITAIVGPSGRGKSTIAHLIPRFFDVGGGAVTGEPWMERVSIENKSCHIAQDTALVGVKAVFLYG